MERSLEHLREYLEEFVALVEAGKSVEAMQRFYAEDVLLFENRELARAGRERCVEFEREQLGKQPEPPRCRAGKLAADPATGVCFIEWVIHFQSNSGRPMRLEEVAVQKWSSAGIIEERFYYEGLIDVGDDVADEDQDARAAVQFDA